MHTARLPALMLLALVAACAQRATEPLSIGIGPSPRLPATTTSLLPTIKVAEATGWPAGTGPVSPAGLSVNAFAEGLDHPRWVYVLPNGDVLVAETNAPERPDEYKGIKGFFQKRTMAKAGAVTVSANRITLLRDADGDGRAEVQTPFLVGLNSPFGMALVDGTLFVANTDAIVSFPYVDGDAALTAPASRVADLPAGPRNHHWTKSLVASADGTRLYVGVGANSNIGENGLALETGRAAIHEIDIATGQSRLFATGLRNPVGLAWNPDTGQLWTAVNERDELGNNLVPDYITSVKDGAFYGWPWSYYGATVDTRVKPLQPERVAAAIAPDYALGAHTASLGLAFANGAALGDSFRNGAFIGQHGSWNRDPISGYKVGFVPFTVGRPSADPVDILSGFLSPGNSEAYGRPVGVAVAADGALLVADDVGNAIWRVTAAPGDKARPR
jgi:glucose/arabinose dehydrogenase